MTCAHCNGECCYRDKREGTTRYAQLVSHEQGTHWCRHCVNGEQTMDDERVKKQFLGIERREP